MREIHVETGCVQFTACAYMYVQYEDSIQCTCECTLVVYHYRLIEMSSSSRTCSSYSDGSFAWCLEYVHVQSCDLDLGRPGDEATLHTCKYVLHMYMWLMFSILRHCVVVYWNGSAMVTTPPITFRGRDPPCGVHERCPLRFDLPSLTLYTL